mgnify:FL=1
MESQESQIILFATTLIIVAFVVFIILLFSIFQKRKNVLLKEQEEAEKRFEREIAETQIEIREETLRNISWELHDNIGQLLTLAKIQLQNATPDNIKEVSTTITNSLIEVRSLSKLINPEAIKNIKLKQAIQLEIDRFNRLNFINAKLNIIGNEKEIQSQPSIIIFRILQEFFSNTIKHSKASNLEVEMMFNEEELEITAKDDGIGFSLIDKSDRGIGLENIKNRAKLIGASAIFLSNLEKGTSLKIIYKL